MTGQLVQDLGLPIALLVAVSYAVFRGVRFVGEHLFDRPGGYITQLVKAHVEFLNQFNGALKSTTDALTEIATLLAELRDMREAERAELKVLLASKKEPDPP